MRLHSIIIVALTIALLVRAGIHREAQPYTISSKLLCREKSTLMRVEVQTINGAQINQEAPVTLEIGSAKYSKEDFSSSNSNELLFQHAFEDKRGCLPKLEGHIVFYLCGKSNCKKIKHDFTAE